MDTNTLNPSIIMTTLNEAYSQFSLNKNHIVPLDFESVDTIPDSHVWHDDSTVIGHDEDDLVFPIPVIDLSDPEAGKLIGEACEKWGVFQLTNHGIPTQVLGEVESMARRLFALPASEKLKALRSPDGVSGYGQARLAPFFDKCMWGEGFTVVGSPADHVSKLWPGDYQVFCDVMEAYQKCTKELATKLLRLILQSITTSEQQLRQISSPEVTDTTLQLNSYPPCPDPTRAMGMAPHTDTSFLTILHQADCVKGLQIFNPGSGRWGMVAPVAGAVTVNVGDLLHVISNGRFHTVRHRVVLKEPKQRVSVALFFFPAAMDFVLSPVGVSDGGGAGGGGCSRYRAVTLKEFIGLKYKSFETALSSIRKDLA